MYVFCKVCFGCMHACKINGHKNLGEKPLMSCLVALREKWAFCP